MAIQRRDAMRRMAAMGSMAMGLGLGRPHVFAAAKDPKWDEAIQKGLAWVVRNQSSLGHWTAGQYPTAMTALAGAALIGSGSTTTQGKYAKSIRRAVDYLLLNKTRQNGLIGDPQTDNRYTYGHGFSMLFLSQVLGEEEDDDRRQELLRVLKGAVDFSGKSQTQSGGWGYVSAKDGNDFDEGSTTITQVQGLRACRNAGIPVVADVIERAKQYIYECKNADGGISYSSKTRGSSRPAITAAALAALYNAGDYDGQHVPAMLEYCKRTLHSLNPGAQSFGHWHYTYLYYSQVVYRQGEEEWAPFREKLYNKIIGEQQQDGSWTGNIGPIYVTASNLTMLQLDQAYLPIYQR